MSTIQPPTQHIPVHIAIIPDGNRRWSKEHNLPTFEGHRRGFDVAFSCVRASRKMGIKIMTLWAFSTENWNRSKEEVSYLMKIYETMIDKNLKEAMKDKSRIIHMGRKDRINAVLREKIINAEEKTKNHTSHYLAIALDYGGRDELIRAVQLFQSEKINTPITQELLKNYLDTRYLPQPEPDIIIRTGSMGDNKNIRTSGFMLWQSAYSEYFFLQKHFPDLTPDDLAICINEYSTRHRRFGR